MGKKSIIVTFAFILLMLGAFAGYWLFGDRHHGFDIVIKNNTSENINGLNITYKDITKDISLPDIEPEKVYKININPKEDFHENSMIIYYKDKRGYVQKNTLIGYFEKGYNGEVNVNINSRDKNGLIIMQTQEKIKY